MSDDKPTGATSAKSHSKQEMLLLLALFVGVVFAFLWARGLQLPLLRAPDGHSVLADPDSFTRWRLVERALAGEGVRIRWMPEENAPYGHANAWSSPMTILGVTLVRAGELFGGMSRAQALEWGGLWLGPLVGLMGLCMLAFLGWRAGGWILAACWIVAWPVLVDVILITGFGNTDHHSLHQLLFICVVAGCLAWARKPTTVGGIFVGLATALAIWSAGSEMLPVWAMVAGLALCELGWRTADEAHMRFWRGWWISGLAGTLCAWLFEFWPHVFHGYLEFISVWHVLLWLILGALLEFVRQPRISIGWKIPAAVAAAGVAVIVAAATKSFDWQHLHVVQDVRFKRLMSVTAECMSYPRDLSGAFQHGLIDFGLLPLLSLSLVFCLRAIDLRTRWIFLVTACYVVLIFDQARWLDFLLPMLVITAGLAVTRLRLRDPLLCLIIMFAATIPPWMISLKVSRNLKSFGSDFTHGPYIETFALRAASNCLGSSAIQPIVLAAWEQSSILAGMGKVRVIGSGFWTNLDGLNDTWEMLTTTSADRFWQLARKREVDFLFTPSPVSLEQDIRESFKGLNGVLPTQAEIHAACVWQILKSDRFPEFQCEAMSRLEPQWRIIRLNGVVQPK